MSMLRIGLVLFSLSATSAGAEVIIAGGSGSFYCEDGADIIKMIESAAKGRGATLGDTCKPIVPGTKIDATSVNWIDDLAVGRGEVDGKKDVAFIARKQTPMPTSEGRTYKRVSSVDVRNSPDKWAGRDIEFRNVSIYWVDDDDVRVLTDSSLTLFARNPRGSEVDFFKANCETQAEALASKCRASVRFRYDKHGEDSPGGLAKRTVLVSSDVEIVRASRPRR